MKVINGTIKKLVGKKVYDQEQGISAADRRKVARLTSLPITPGPWARAESHGKETTYTIDGIGYCFSLADANLISDAPYLLGLCRSLLDDVDAMQARAEKAEAEVERLRRTLRGYKEDLCEGYCNEGEWADAGHCHPDIQWDCGGCRAACALQRAEVSVAEAARRIAYDCDYSAEVLRDAGTFQTAEGILRQAAKTLRALTEDTP